RTAFNSKGSTDKPKAESPDYRPTATPMEKDQLSLTVKTLDGVMYRTDNIPLEIVFHNDGKEPVRMLDVFNNASSKKIFFVVTLSDANDSPLFTSGGGKITFSKDSPKYLELGPGDETTVMINLVDFVPAARSLEPGIYKLSVTYFNQYGENCFKGPLK